MSAKTESPVVIRISRGITVAMNPRFARLSEFKTELIVDYDKAEFAAEIPVTISPPQSTHDAMKLLQEAFDSAEEALDARIKEFLEGRKYSHIVEVKLEGVRPRPAAPPPTRSGSVKPDAFSISTEGWQPYRSGKPGALKLASEDPELTKYLKEHKHDFDHRWKCEDGYFYWLSTDPNSDKTFVHRKEKNR